VRIVAACTLALTLASSAQAADVDWKMYGGASIDGPSYCFYDANTVTRASNSFVRVWTKCLALKELDGVNLDKRILDSIATRVVAGYVPPIIVIGRMEFKQLPDVAAYEEIANISTIDPQAQIFDELNCSERMSRTLSVAIHTNGQRGFNNKPSDWEYVPPEGNNATLLKLLCR
jgi:hypothetical protein